jgi:peptidoglycan biosynthesis protein MviN/MurJ (putative lipid II flippase)
MLYFMARAGTGAISANNCATRIGMLGYSLFAQPLVQLLQSRLCRSAGTDHQRLAKRYITVLALGAAAFAITLFIVRRPLVALVYMRGNFSSTALEEVLAILPAWLCYFVVLCLNTIISQYMFHVSIGSKYTRNMLAGYAGTNILRFTTAHSMDAAWIVWCGVIAEGGAFLANVLTSATREVEAPTPITTPYAQEA